MPFDQFTIEQIAGDMLPNATPQQRIATGFHRNAMTNEEGGVDPEESLYEVLVDRVNTTATVWLGSTLACAQCHNHKYDPFSQKDYFRLLAFFANTDYETRGVRRRHALLRGPARSGDRRSRKRARRSAAGRDRARSKAELKATTPALAAAQTAWERRTARRRRARGRPLPPRSVDGHRRRHARDAAGRIRSAPRARTRSSRPTPSRRGRRCQQHHRPAPRSAARSVAAERRPGPRRLRPFPRDRPARRGRRRRRRGRRRSRRSRSTTIKVDDFAYAFDTADLLATAARLRRPQARRLGHQRDARGGRARAAACRARSGHAVRLRRRHARPAAHRPSRRHDRPGHRPLPPGGDNGGRSARSARRSRRGCVRSSRSTAGAPHRGADDGPRHGVPRRHAAPRRTPANG